MTNYHVKIFILTIILWGLWKVRNKRGIGKKFPRSSNGVLYKIFNLLQKWRILLKPQDAKFLDEKIEVMKTMVEGFLEAN